MTINYINLLGGTCSVSIGSPDPCDHSQRGCLETMFKTVQRAVETSIEMRRAWISKSRFKTPQISQGVRTHVFSAKPQVHRDLSYIIKLTSANQKPNLRNIQYCAFEAWHGAGQQCSTRTYLIRQVSLK